MKLKIFWRNIFKCFFFLFLVGILISFISSKLELTKTVGFLFGIFSGFFSMILLMKKWKPFGFVFEYEEDWIWKKENIKNNE